MVGERLVVDEEDKPMVVPRVFVPVPEPTVPREVVPPVVAVEREGRRGNKGK